jgi:hypothetical protein
MIRIVFLVFELVRLDEVDRRVRYERFANSFNYTPADQLLAKESHRLHIEFSYQFPHLWLLVAPVAGVSLMYSITPLFWRAASEEEIFFGKRIKMYTVMSACGEVMGRIAIETVWRYFMLDLKGRRRRLWKWEWVW